MKKIFSLILGCALAACGGGGDTANPNVQQLSKVDVGVSGVAAKVTYDSANDRYTVTPTGGAPVTLPGNATFDLGGFDFARNIGMGGTAFLAFQSRNGASVAMFLADASDPNSMSVLLSRPAGSDMPITGDAKYEGDYYATVFIGNFYGGAMTGDATVNVSFTNGSVDGSITNRQYFDGGIPSATPVAATTLDLETGDLSADGRVTDIGGSGLADADGGGFDIGPRSFIPISGSYDGLISGNNGTEFIGGVDMTYIDQNDISTQAREVGGIITTKIP